MIITDTHTHLYLDAFSTDRDAVIDRAVTAGVSRMLLPNIDASTISGMLHLSDRYPGVCLPMMGLHPTSVKADYRNELNIIKGHLDRKWVDWFYDLALIHEQDGTTQEGSDAAFGITPNGETHREQ